MIQRKPNNINIDIICSHIHEVKDNLTSTDLEMLEMMHDVAVEYVKDYTGNPKIMEKDAVTVVILTLIADMWENRGLTITSAMVVNPLISNILGMYSVNLLPEVD